MLEIIFFVSEINMTATAEFEIDEKYMPEYSNPSSEQYKTFVQKFRFQVNYVDCIYHHIAFLSKKKTYLSADTYYNVLICLCGDYFTPIYS